MNSNKSVFSISRTTLFIHVFVWVSVFLLPLILRSDFYENNEWTLERLITLFSFPIGFCFLFYFNSIVLVPKLIYKNKIWLYLLILIALCLFFAYMHGVLHNMLFTEKLASDHKHYSHFSFWILLPYAFVAALSTSIRVLRDRIVNEKIRNETINENLKTELSFLRSQISPHFLSNVMNSIVSLSRKKSDLLEPVVIKLSGLLRYMLYESDEKKVTIEKELEYLNSYIDLQTLRFGEEVKVVFDLDLDRTDFYIEPMLFIPFVENAFKHGVTMLVYPEIRIKLSAKNKILEFVVFNKYTKQSEDSKDKDSGIGLSNVKRRLKLLYPNHHDFIIRDTGNTFEITLTIQLND